MTEDERFMGRALELASEPPFTSPNPRVGAVIVSDGRILSEGVHHGAGTPHAEALALEGAESSSATLYVNLEPCTHQGRMPPCAPMVIQAGIARVVIATEDPDGRVAGKGIELLRDAGIEVDVGVLEDEARALNRSYLHHRTTGRPFVTLKMALSLDGKLAAADGSSQWITGEVTRERVHARRLEADGVVVGAGTILADDPSLTVRDVDAPRQPVRVVCDATGRIPPTSRIFSTGEVVVMTTVGCDQSLMNQWKEAGAEVVVVPTSDTGGIDLAGMVENLGARGWLEVYCEGGAELATSLLREELVDRIDLNYGPLLLGGSGLGLGDLGVISMGDAPRWRTVEVARSGHDALVVVERDR